MKVIDLYVKIANKEIDELPKKIKVRGCVYYLEIDEEFINYKPKNGDWLLNQFLWKLNEEIEILEEEKKIPEKLGYQDNADGTFYLNCKKYNSEPIKILSKKINDIIDYLDYLKSKG